MQDLKVLNDYLNTTEDKIDMTAKTAKKSFDQLKMAIDPAYRATKIFKDQVLVAQKAVATGAATQKEYATAFAQIQKQAAAAGVTINQFGQVADVNTRKLKRFGAVGMQQVGYQVQDFAVQVQGGTSVMVALGQQGSQLLGIFGPYGAIAGMILAIGTGLAGAFMAAKKAASDATETSVDYKKVLDDLKTATSDLALENYMLAGSFDTLTQAQTARAIEIKKQEIADLRKEADPTGQGFLDPTKRGARQRGRDQVTDPAAKKGLFGGKSPLEELQELQDKLKGFNKEYDKNLGLKAQQDAAKAAAEGLKNVKEIAIANFDRAMNAKAAYGADAEALLILRQSNEAEALRRKLISERVDIMGVEAQMAIGQLEDAHEFELAEFRRKAAIQEAAEAKRAADQADAKREKDKADALRKLIDQYKTYQSLVNSVTNSIESGLVSIADRTKTVEEAFRDMAADIIRQLYRVLVVQRMVGSFNIAEPEKSSGLAGFFGNMFRAKGGPVTAGQPYIVGERGPELFVPSSNGGVVANDKMGGGVTVVQNLNISTGVSQTVRAEIRNLMPQIAETAKSAVVDGKRRGGNYGKAFA